MLWILGWSVLGRGVAQGSTRRMVPARSGRRFVSLIAKSLTARAMLMAGWAWGRSLEDGFEQSNHVDLRSILSHTSDHDDMLPSLSKAGSISLSVQAVVLKHTDEPDQTVPRIPIAAIFYRNDSAARGVPHSFVSFLRSYPALPQIVVSRELRSTLTPDLPHYDRVRRRACPGYRPIHRPQGPGCTGVLYGHYEVSTTSEFTDL
jgi:hypothetical protein